MNKLFTCEREVLFRTTNDDRLTVKEIIGSFSAYGYSADEFLSGKIGWLDIVYLDDRKCFSNYIFSNCSSQPCAHRFVSKSGEVFWFSCVFVAEGDSIWIKVQDISKFKQCEQDAKKHESIIRNIFDYSADGMSLADKDGNVREWSSGFEKMTGLPKAMVVGKPIWEACANVFVEQISESGREKIKAEQRQVFADMQEKSFIRHIINEATGEYRIVNSRYFPIPIADEMMMGIICNDVTELMQSFEIIRQSEQKLSAERDRIKVLGDHLPDGCMYRFALECKTGRTYMMYVSGTFEKITGLSAEAVLSDYRTFFSKIVHPEDSIPMQMAIEKAVVAKANFYQEVRVFIDGIQRWLLFSSHPHPADGDLIIWEGIIHDITPRKEATRELENVRRRQAILIKILQIVQSMDNLPEALNHSLAEMGKFTNVSHVYIFEKSADKNIFNHSYEWFNKGVKSELGNLMMSIEESKAWSEIFDAGDYVCTSDISSIKSEIISKAMMRLGVKSTVVFPLTSSGVHYGFVGFNECTFNRKWEHAEVELLKSFSQIISTTTRRYQAETSIRLSQQTMRTVLDNVKSGIVVIDVDTSRIIFGNKKIQKFAGCDVENKICWETLQPSKDGICEFCPRNSLLANRNIAQKSHRWEYKKNGRWYESNSSIIEWIDGRTVQLENSIDITDRKKAEIELTIAKDKAEESDKLKSAFLANISHEIRTPLNAILGFLNLAATGIPTQEVMQNYVSLISRSSSQLLRQIENIIDVSKIEIGQMELYPIMLNINTLMYDLKIFLDSLFAEKKHIELVLDDSGFIEPCLIYVDAKRLRQTLCDLIENALKFTEKGYVRFAYRKSSFDMLEFVIEDTGIGINKDKLDVIFDSFRQIELSNTRRYGGTGLGLSISRGLVKLMGGEMWVESQVGAGSSFYFTIPYKTLQE